MKKKLIVILGPTASGKTALSITLAKKLNTEIISADSRQFFKEMSIGTAKPDLEEQDGVIHHFIDSHSINEFFTAGQFERDALTVLNSIFKTNDYAICVGGSGLYINALCDGLDDIPGDLNVRKELNQQFEEYGIEPILNELKEKDPAFFEFVDQQNHQRVIRAVEVIRVSGKPYSSLRKSSKKERPFEIIKIGIEHPRELLYDRINQRVDIMIENGLVEEVQSLIEYRNHNALQTVGYKEIYEFLDGNISKEEAIELLKRNTRRFAKRQLTWFRKDESTRWIQFDELEQFDIGKLNKI
jgi:tRNA dimethylallyltransferase